MNRTTTTTRRPGRPLGSPGRPGGAQHDRLPGPFVERWSWQLRARCRAIGTELFFRPVGETARRQAHREAAAKSICAGCPVREQCLEHALQVGERYGIWGGTTEAERAELTREQGGRRAA